MGRRCVKDATRIVRLPRTARDDSVLPSDRRGSARVIISALDALGMSGRFIHLARRAICRGERRHPSPGASISARRRASPRPYDEDGTQELLSYGLNNCANWDALLPRVSAVKSCSRRCRSRWIKPQAAMYAVPGKSHRSCLRSGKLQAGTNITMPRGGQLVKPRQGGRTSTPSAFLPTSGGVGLAAAAVFICCPTRGGS